MVSYVHRRQHVHFLKFTGDAFKVKANASIVEALFQTQLHTFCSVKHQELCLVKHLGNLSIPTSLSRHIIMVTGKYNVMPHFLCLVNFVKLDTRFCVQ